MRKRKERTEGKTGTLISNTEVGYGEINKEEGKGFFACYLLCSLSPRFKGHTYIGFTVNPSRRIRQHNGEITSGAVRTKNKRPWEMILCIYGFPTNVSALQFEWAWQHPRESLAVKNAALSFKSLSGIANRIKLAYTMLTLPPWQSLKLNVNFFSTKYTKHCAGCPSLPKQMKVQVCPMDELPCYIGGGMISDEKEDDEGCEHEDGENGIGDRNLSEISKDISVDNSAEYTKTDHDWGRWIEDDDLRQPKDLPSSREEDNARSSSNNFLLQTLPTSIASVVNMRELVEERSPFGSIEQTGNKLGRTTEQILPTIMAARGNQSQPINSLLLPEVGFKQSSESLTPRESRLPFFVVDSPLQTPSSRLSGFINTVQAVEDRDSFELIEESGCKLGPATKQLATTITAPSENQSPSENSPICPPEISLRQLSEREVKLPFCLVDSPMQSPSSSVTKLADTVVEAKDINPFGLIKESRRDKMKAANKQQSRTPTAANKDQPPSSCSSFHPSPDVEVISLLTPSSDCTIRSCRNKKRASLAQHDIIDLTKSPMFVQL